MDRYPNIDMLGVEAFVPVNDFDVEDPDKIRRNQITNVKLNRTFMKLNQQQITYETNNRILHNEIKEILLDLKAGQIGIIILCSIQYMFILAVIYFTFYASK